ncbi:prepilin-type N-terminal cleavage/methylation domain-containing protein [Candidatus Thiodiazotropha sp. CDECU1]|uniref:prepilin-type N-terminal cleavage/methylation domain-containing protein n=1 Tax=Candidatus Thiodiazotropha sp. CDECU1 TaxID=3065865 RepID=UPI00292F2CD8|nr:prepilin-type N-terminal cleavage/methylation domain-containing protein [Candidatus Thiodiazotropha sp. CDECU1]
MTNPERMFLEQAANIDTSTRGRKQTAIVHRSDGFTLLEVMVAMLLLAVIMTTSVSMLFINLKGWERLTEHSDAILEEHLITKRVRSMIQHLVPLVWRDQKQRVLALSGETQLLQFLSKAPQQHNAGGLFEYLLVQERAPEQGYSLVLYFSPLNPTATGLSLPENGARRVLLTGLEEIQFAYYGSKQERSNIGWHNSWEAVSVRYPELIRLTLRYPGDEGKTQESYFHIQQNNPAIVQRK